MMNNMRYYLLAALFTCSLSGAHAQSGVKYPYVKVETIYSEAEAKDKNVVIVVSHDEGGGFRNKGC